MRINSIEVLKLSICRLAGLRLSAALLAGLSFGSSVYAQSEKYPARPIRVVVPASVSTPPDIISRIILNEITTRKGWTFVVENKAGAAQTIGGMDVKNSPPDGYSIWFMGMVGTTAPTLVPKVNLVIARDFTPVVALARSNNVLVVHPDVKANSVKELVDLIRANPGKLNFASGGTGTPAHLIGEIFRLENKLDVSHVPYFQFPQAIQDLLGNRIQYGFLTTLPVVELINAGKLKAIAVSSKDRIDIIKSVPTAIEQGFSSLVVDDWFGAMVPAKTAADIVKLLNAEFNLALQGPSVIAGLKKVGAFPTGGSSEEFAAHVQREIKRWSELIKAAGIKPE
jgi:tripartite-type tricarboxylate transporter receptor subunit TctC